MEKTPLKGEDPVVKPHIKDLLMVLSFLSKQMLRCSLERERGMPSSTCTADDSHVSTILSNKVVAESASHNIEYLKLLSFTKVPISSGTMIIL